MFERYLFIPNPWKPIVDGGYSSKPFLPESIKSALTSGNFYQVPMIVGHDKDEGAMFLPQFLNNLERMSKMGSDFDKLGPVLLMTMDEHAVTEEDSKVANMYRKRYLDANFTRENALGISRMMGDVRYTGPIHMGVDVLRKTSHKPVYYYMYR